MSMNSPNYNSGPRKSSYSKIPTNILLNLLWEKETNSRGGNVDEAIREDIKDIKLELKSLERIKQIGERLNEIDGELKTQEDIITENEDKLDANWNATTDSIVKSAYNKIGELKHERDQINGIVKKLNKYVGLGYIETIRGFSVAINRIVDTINKSSESGDESLIPQGIGQVIADTHDRVGQLELFNWKNPD